MKFLSLNKQQIVLLVRRAFGKTRTLFAFFGRYFELRAQCKLILEYSKAEELPAAASDLLVERYKSAREQTPGLAAAVYWKDTFGNVAIRKAQRKG